LGLAAIGLIGLLDVAIAHLYTPAAQPAPFFDPERKQVMQGEIDAHARNILAQATVAVASKNIDLPMSRSAQGQ
jgi:hypothetical protein